MKYDLSKIMLKAWRLYRKTEGLNFWISAKAEPVNAERIEAAKQEAGIVEEVKTWSGWKDAGFEVQHGSRAVFAVSLIHGSRGDGKSYRASFFTRSQVQAVA